MSSKSQPSITVSLDEHSKELIMHAVLEMRELFRKHKQDLVAAVIEELNRTK